MKNEKQIGEGYGLGKQAKRLHPYPDLLTCTLNLTSSLDVGLDESTSACGYGEGGYEAFDTHQIAGCYNLGNEICSGQLSTGDGSGTEIGNGTYTGQLLFATDGIDPEGIRYVD